MLVHIFQENQCEKHYTRPYTMIEIPPQTGNIISQKGPVYEHVNIRRVIHFIDQDITHIEHMNYIQNLTQERGQVQLVFKCRPLVSD